MHDRALVVALMTTAVMAATPRVAVAQMDLSGEWTGRVHEDAPHRIAGPDLGDYAGLPINDAARLKADSWDASILSMPERQTIPHPATYIRGPANIRIQKQIDPRTQQVIAWTIFGMYGHETRTIWMDGRPHPSKYAAHTWQGFSTGTWDGTMLRVRTTHLKGSHLQRNGIVHSDRAIMLDYWVRHGDVLTNISAVEDPVYLTEPLVRTTNWVFNPGQQLPPRFFEAVDEIAGRPRGYVPHHLPDSNPALREVAQRTGIPYEAFRGGAATMYPEYGERLKRR